MNNDELVCCEYANCEVIAPISEMETTVDDGIFVYLCSTCADKVVNTSGYCSLSCQLGYGCDDSC